MKKVLTFLFLLVIGSYTFSACAENACSGVGDEVLKSVYPNGAGNIYLQAGTDRENLDCDLVQGQYMTLKSDHLAFEEAYSTILSALLAGKYLTVRIVNDSPVCEVSYVRMWM